MDNKTNSDEPSPTKLDPDEADNVENHSDAATDLGQKNDFEDPGAERLEVGESNPTKTGSAIVDPGVSASGQIDSTGPDAPKPDGAASDFTMNADAQSAGDFDSSEPSALDVDQNVAAEQSVSSSGRGEAIPTKNADTNVAGEPCQVALNKGNLANAELGSPKSVRAKPERGDLPNASAHESNSAKATTTHETNSGGVSVHGTNSGQRDPARQGYFVEAVPGLEVKSGEGDPVRRGYFVEAVPGLEIESGEGDLARETSLGEVAPIRETISGELGAVHRTSSAKVAPTHETIASEGGPAHESYSAEIAPANQANSGEFDPAFERCSREVAASANERSCVEVAPAGANLLLTDLKPSSVNELARPDVVSGRSPTHVEEPGGSAIGEGAFEDRPPTRCDFDKADFLARLTLHHVVEPADPIFSRLQELASADQLLAAVRSADLADLEPDARRRDRVAERTTAYRLRLAHIDVDATVKAARAVGARYLTPGHEHWPAGFDDLGPERPLGVWWLGSWVPNGDSPVASMVGARACTGYGSYVAGALAAALGRARIPVASGGALGIDAAAHRGALAVGGDTIAFLACGIDLAYPRANELLLNAIRGQGAVVSELPPGCHPNRFRFLTRNRLIAALGTATVVVEAAKRSGSLVTARRAADLGRLVLAVPGPITSELSIGTHELIRDGAQIVESPRQLAAELSGAQEYEWAQADSARRARSTRSVTTSAEPTNRTSKSAERDNRNNSRTLSSTTSAAAQASSRSTSIAIHGPAVDARAQANATSADAAHADIDLASDLDTSLAQTSAPSPTSDTPAVTIVTTTKTNPTVGMRPTTSSVTISGLGPDEQIVLEALPTARTAGMQIPEVSGATGIDSGIVFAALGRLAALGLAAKNGCGWVLAPGREREARRYE